MARTGEQYLFRFPEGMRKRLQARADTSARSLNAELIQAIEEYLQRPSVLDRLDKIESVINPGKDNK